MKKIEVEIEGETPLLMNSPKSMILESEKAMKQTTKKYDIKADAKKLAYTKKDGELYIPAEAIKGCLVNAASYKKIGKYAAKPIIAGGVHITPNEIGLGTKKYDIDVRTVVIQRARVVKGRPCLHKWKVRFDVNINENLIQSDADIRTILEEGGQRIGILDFRPQKLGSFGMFRVTKWLPRN